MPASSVSSDSSSILSPGITIFLSTCLYFHVVCGRTAPLGFGNDLNLGLCTKRFICLFISKKGTYCYNYMNSMERFDETSLPSKEHFYNRLYDKRVSEEQYTHLQCGRH